MLELVKRPRTSVASDRPLLVPGGPGRPSRLMATKEIWDEKNVHQSE